MNISITKTSKSQFIFPIRRTTLPQCEIDILNKKSNEFKIRNHKSQDYFEKKCFLKQI